MDEDDEEKTPDVIEMSRLLGMTLDEYLRECEERKKKEEFFSDKCWSE